MDHERLLEATHELIAIPSTAGRPRELWAAYEFMRSFVTDRAREHGAQITIKHFESGGKPSFFAFHGTEFPAQVDVLLNGHVDVAPATDDQFKMTIVGDRVYGRGIYDQKTAALGAAAAFCRNKNAALQITTDEEAGGEDGTAHQVRHGNVRSRFTICTESGRPLKKREIANAAKGVVVADATLLGKLGHGAYPQRGTNAFTNALRFGNAILDLFPEPVDDEECNKLTTITPMKSETNSDGLTQIPSLATVRLDCRYLRDDPDFVNEAAFGALIQRIDPAARLGKVHIWGQPMYTPPDDPFLVLLKEAAEEVEGGPFELVQRNGTSDGRHFGLIGGRACEFGIAGYDQHGPEEHITIQALKNFVNTLDVFFQKVTATDVAK